MSIATAPSPRFSGIGIALGVIVLLAGLVVGLFLLLRASPSDEPQPVLLREDAGGVEIVNLVELGGEPVFLVRFSQTELVAVNAAEPEGGCRIVVREGLLPERGLRPSTLAAGQPHALFSPCSGAIWDLAGVYLDGGRNARNLTVYPARIEGDGSAQVDLHDPVCSRRGSLERERIPC